MLKLPNYSEDAPQVLVMKLIAALPQEEYFITALFSKVGEATPSTLGSFIESKIEEAKQYKAFKTVFTELDWRIILTFIPTRAPLDPKHSLTAAFIKLCQESRGVDE